MSRDPVTERNAEMALRHVAASSKMLEAAMSQLDARMILGDEKLIEQQRQACVAAFEATIDAKIIAFKALKILQED